MAPGYFTCFLFLLIRATSSSRIASTGLFFLSSIKSAGLLPLSFSFSAFSQHVDSYPFKFLLKYSSMFLLLMQLLRYVH